MELVFARFFLLNKLLIKEDLPTFDLPHNISSGRSDFGRDLSSNTDFMNLISLNILNKKRVTEYFDYSSIIQKNVEFIF